MLSIKHPLHRRANGLVGSMNTADPATGTALALGQFRADSLYTPRAGCLLLCILDPAEPFIACKWCD